MIDEARLATLTEDAFNQLALVMLKRRISERVRLHPVSGKDRGRDATYSGPGRGDFAGMSGEWVFQLKFRTKSLARRGVLQLLTRALAELERRLHLPAYYIMIVNFRCSAQCHDEAAVLGEQFTGRPTVLIWDVQELVTFLNSHPLYCFLLGDSGYTVLPGVGEGSRLQEMVSQMDELIAANDDPALLPRFKSQRAEVLALLKSELLTFEEHGYLCTLPSGGEVLCLDTSLEQVGYDYWESFGPFSHLLNTAMEAAQRAPGSYKTIVTVSSFDALRGTPQAASLRRLATMFGRVGAPISFVEGNVLQKRGLYQDLSVMGGYGSIAYQMPRWLGTSASRSRSEMRRLRDIWQTANELQDLVRICSSADLDRLDELLGRPPGGAVHPLESGPDRGGS